MGLLITLTPESRELWKSRLVSLVLTACDVRKAKDDFDIGV